MECQKGMKQSAPWSGSDAEHLTQKLLDTMLKMSMNIYFM